MYRILFILAAVLAVVVTFLPANASPNITPNPHGILFGINTGDMSVLQSETAGITAERAYFTASQGVPKTWPKIVPGMVGVVSFKPNNADFSAGKDDAATIAFLKQAPSGSWVAIWHEGNEPHDHLNRLAYLSATRRLKQIVTTNHIPVKVGQIFGTYPVQFLGQDLGQWTVPGMDFYAFDGYQAHSTQTPSSVFGKSIADVRNIAGSTAPLAVTETNTTNVSAVDQWAQATWNYWAPLNPLAFMWFAAPQFSNLVVMSPAEAQFMARMAPQN